MLKFILGILGAFCVITLQAQSAELKQIKYAGPDARRINFVILAEGYTDAELNKFWSDAGSITGQMFDYPPLSNYQAFFNLYAIGSVSPVSGAMHPGTATDVGEPASPVKTEQNAFGTTFDFAGIHRLLYTNSHLQINTVLANTYPGYDQIILLVNDPEYGGAGGRYATCSTHRQAGQIAIHEIGHSFALVTDEYWNGSPRETRNMSRDNNPETVRWKDWLGQAGIGVYPYGSSSPQSEWFRPHQDCMMRQLNRQFCAVCKESFIDRIYRLTSPIDEVSPVSAQVTFEAEPLFFSVATIDPNPNTLKVEWLIGDSIVGSQSNSFVNTGDWAEAASQILRLRVTDTTAMSKSYAPESGYIFERSWTINNRPALPGGWVNLDISPTDWSNELQWSFTQPQAGYSSVLERKHQSGDWEEIARFEAPESKQTKAIQHWRDTEPEPGLSTYRIRIITKDGQEHFSPEKSVSKTSRWFYSISPNPSTGPVMLDIYSDLSGRLSAKLYNAAGQMVHEELFNVESGQQRLTFDPGILPAGTYQMLLDRNDGEWRRQLSLQRF